MQPRLLGLVAALVPVCAFAHLDVAFLLDTTGSMGGELSEVKDRVRQLAETLRTTRGQERVRFGVVAYRDHGDKYVTAVSPLTSDVEETFRFLAGLTAAGGGDGPEDIISGLRVALHDLHWDAGADTERQIFLIGDAPPHLDYANEPTPDELIGLAQRERIVINAIGCRSLPKEGVEFFRKLAYATEGSYQHIGRVTVREGEVAQAMLKSLAPRVEAEQPPADPGAELTAGSDPTPSDLGLLVRAQASPSQKGTGCGLTVSTPSGVELAAPPRATREGGAVVVSLKLKPGLGAAARSWTLPWCVPLATPVRTWVGG
jgi:uncharacterized protein YegL